MPLIFCLDTDHDRDILPCRRGLMRLQAESRRQSAAPNSLDLSRAGIAGFSSPPSSKRASFTPLTGRTNGHRRVSSVSGDGNGLAVLHLPELNPSPNSQLSFQDSNLGPQSSRRSLFGRYSPPNPEVSLPSINAPPSEVEALKKELESLKKELADTRAELAEANEAKEASDMCVKALREFIAENQVGENTSGESSTVKLSPPPTMTNGQETDTNKKINVQSSGWGFKLWKAEGAPKTPVTNTTAPSSTPTTSSASIQQTFTTSAPFSRLGGFFSSRASVLSTTTSSSTLQTSTGLSRDSFRNSISGRSVSDTSSVIEPRSPENEYQGTVKVVVPESGEPVVGVDSAIGVPVEKGPLSVPLQQPAAVIG